MTAIKLAVAGIGLVAIGAVGAGIFVGRSLAGRYTPHPVELAEAAQPDVFPVANAAAKSDKLNISIYEPPQPKAPELPAKIETLDSAPAFAAHATPVLKKPVTREEAKRAAAEHAYVLLNDAQIASIKRRLQLSPDQERMWPAVEAALRSIAYAKAQGEAHRYGAPKSAAQLANIDPNSAEVQGLKSAAFPLILSFNSEQKSEVRTLAHVMGLDQLASQF